MNEYAHATIFFDDLLDAAGLNRDRLFIVPGNHDVDRRAGEFLTRTISSEDIADRYFSPDQSLLHLTQKFQAFLEWYNDYFKTIRSFPTNTTCSPVEIVMVNGIRVAVLPMNSALFCIDDHDHQKLFIGRRCIAEAKAQLGAADLTIGLIHHPLDWLSPIEQSKIKATLGETIDLLLQGHYHETETEGIANTYGGYLRLAAGAAWQSQQWAKSAMYATFDSNEVSIFPIRYENRPSENWTLDTSLFPSPTYIKSFPIPGRADPLLRIASTVTLPQSEKQHQHAAERYQAILKQELGYIRMLGLPGIESVKVNLNNDTFVQLRLSDRQGSIKQSSIKSLIQVDEHIFFADELMKQTFHDGRKRRMLLIIGDPGAGKTTLLKYYALSAFEDSKRLGFTEPLTVFYFPLRDIVRDNERRYDTLPANLANWSVMHHQTIDAHIFNDWLNNGTSLVLLDGLDEISDTMERREVCRWIDAAWAGFSKAFFVITSRSTGYNKEDGIELEADYERADVQDFTQEQQECFLLNWFTAILLKEPREKGIDVAVWEEKQKEEAKERTTAIVAHLNIQKNKELRQLAAIPMMLQIMAILWKDRDYMPESRVKLFDSALDYLLEFRDKRRNIKPLLSATQARQVLAPVSLWMQEELKRDEASKSDIHNAMREWLDTLDNPPTAEEFCNYLVKRAGLFIESGGKDYLFRHKSFREYLAGFQLKEDRPYEHLKKLVAHFGEDWWEETLRFFIASVDANVFDAFMAELFNSSVSTALTLKQQLLLQTIIEEAKGKKVDSLCKKLLDPTTTDGCQRVILDCLKAIAKPAALEALQSFSDKGLAKNKDIADRAAEVSFQLLYGLQRLTIETKPSHITTKPQIINPEKLPLSFRNSFEQNSEYILIKGGSYIYSGSEQEERVESLYMAKYPVTQRLYSSFINSLQPNDSFNAALNNIAKSNAWGKEFEVELKKEKNNLATLFRSKYDEDRKLGGNDNPVTGITWYAARAYCLWLSLLEGNENLYRLPTEIEWEWAAGGRRDGTILKVRKYPWPETNGDPTSKLANYAGNIGSTTPVGRYPDGATPEGLYDMAGNAWEWMDNLYNGKEAVRSLRGGSWGLTDRYLCCSARNYGVPDDRDVFIGFRVVRQGILRIPEPLSN
jgi:formylglycine-generating enzyme required for sulfatase activity/GTPase SAR1 family protein